MYFCTVYQYNNSNNSIFMCEVNSVARYVAKKLEYPCKCLVHNVLYLCYTLPQLNNHGIICGHNYPVIQNRLLLVDSRQLIDCGTLGNRLWLILDNLE